MERYDSIEYGFDREKPVQNDRSVHTTDKDGFITSQHYVEGECAAQEDNPEQSGGREPKLRKERKKSDGPREIVVALQLVICVVLAVAAFAIKSIGGELYQTVRDEYYANLNNSLVINIERDSNDQAVKDIVNDAQTE